MKAIFITITAALAIVSCSKFEFSPNQTRLPEEKTNLNAKAIERILKIPERGKIRIGFTGDTQRFYSETQRFVSKINSITDVDFVIAAGDLADFGLQREFEMIHERLGMLNVPYVAVIGNHGHLANGEEVFRRMYGPLNFSFTHDSIKYIFLNTCGRENNFSGQVPDLFWLESELDAGPEVLSIMVVCHVPPFSGEFDPALREDFKKVMRECDRLLMVLHGHGHAYSFEDHYGDGVIYLNSASPSKDECVLLTIERTGYHIERVPL